MFEKPNQTPAAEKQEDHEKLSQEYKAVAAITCGVLWGALKAAGKYDVSIPMGLMGSLDMGIKPTEKEEKQIDEEGWIGTMIKKAERAYGHIESIENLFTGKK